MSHVALQTVTSKKTRRQGPPFRDAAGRGSQEVSLSYEAALQVPPESDVFLNQTMA
jgi:hypothetical protein